MFLLPKVAESGKKGNAMLYIVVNESRTRCKLGYSRDPEQRLKALQTGNPERLQLVATYPAGRRDEAKYHRMLQHQKLAGEWFRWCPEMEEIARRWG